MDPAERERSLRQRFGPPGGVDSSLRLEPARTPRRTIPRWLVLGILGVLAVVGGVALGFALTPHDHVAPGCWWWTARQVGDVTSGSRGCVRGYTALGGWLAEGKNSQDYALYYSLSNPDTPQIRPDCPFRRGDAVVVRYHAVVDDGQIIIVIEDCN